jgi:hypothetical protein
MKLCSHTHGAPGQVAASNQFQRVRNHRIPDSPNTRRRGDVRGGRLDGAIRHGHLEVEADGIDAVTLDASGLNEVCSALDSQGRQWATREDVADDRLHGHSVLLQHLLDRRFFELEGGEARVFAQRVLGQLLLRARRIVGAIRQQRRQANGEEDEGGRDGRR